MSCAEPSEARLRAANQEMVCFISVRASKARDCKSKPQNASFLSRCVKLCFVQTPLARFPFLLSQVFIFVLKQKGKQYNLAALKVPERALWRALWEGPLGPLWELLGRSSGASLGAFLRLLWCFWGSYMLLLWGFLGDRQGRGVQGEARR